MRASVLTCCRNLLKQFMLCVIYICKNIFIFVYLRCMPTIRICVELVYATLDTNTIAQPRRAPSAMKSSGPKTLAFMQRTSFTARGFSVHLPQTTRYPAQKVASNLLQALGSRIRPRRGAGRWSEKAPAPATGRVPEIRRGKAAGPTELARRSLFCPIWPANLAKQDAVGHISIRSSDGYAKRVPTGHDGDVAERLKAAVC